MVYFSTDMFFVVSSSFLRSGIRKRRGNNQDKPGHTTRVITLGLKQPICSYSDIYSLAAATLAIVMREDPPHPLQGGIEL